MKQNEFLASILSSMNLDDSRVYEMISSVFKNTDDVLRIYAYLSGKVDKPEVPQTSTFKRNAELKSYDFFNNRVCFNYWCGETRYFSTQEEADEADNSILYEDCNKMPGCSYYNRGDKTIKKEFYTLSYNDCSLDYWLNN